MNPHDELNSLLQLFPNHAKLIENAEHVPAALLPKNYRQMLVHDHHMTVAMEDYYDCSVDVKILASRQDNGQYCRKILLTKQGTDDAVQFGIVRFNFSYVTDEVRREILAGEIPLGRVLINHNVLRHVDLGALLRITVGPRLSELLQMNEGEITYGRLATIFCNQKPAVDLLEITIPLSEE